MTEKLESQAVHFYPTATVSRFILSDAFLNLLMGPRGEGKTTGGLFKPIFMAQRLPEKVLPIRMAVVRDTWTNLDRSVLDTIRECEAKDLVEVQWLKDGTQAILEGGLVHLFFFGMEHSKDINKLQGFGIGALWIEEPAPAADLSFGVSPEVLGVGVTSLRQQGVPHWVQITMNPPDEDHWTLAVGDKVRELLDEKPVKNAECRFFNIPKGENPYITFEKRERDQIYLLSIGRGDLVSRLVEGKVGQIILGEQLMPEYGDDVHVAKKPLPILRGVEIVRLWDFGLNPTCVWTQVSPLGHWHILGCVRGDNIGLEQLIESQVGPWESFFLHDPTDWMFRDIIDPAGYQREQSSSERSAATTLIDMLNAAPEAGAIEWAERKDSLKAILRRSGKGGTKMFLVDPDCKIIRRALRGGAHYPKDALGRVTPTLQSYKKASGIHSHPMDCLMIGAAKLFPLPELHHRPKKAARKPVPASRRAQGWMGV
ncbi:hypothetical protein LCGC14_1848720 [marine sediment metagenome]|uniref:Phage terminase large subunit N-terminal domain-containing protein n=1 Tax=marine sediment metagenome TaxID=412755 RepID=A0A0F9GAX9_9ZZZZ